MAVFFIVGVGVAYWSEAAGNPILTVQGVDPSAGNLEGKEIRNGQAMSVLYAIATSGTSTGSVNTMHDSLTPLAGMVPMFNLLAGCIWPGGVGAGLYGFLVLAIVAVFVAGLMVGRTPEYLGKKIKVREMKYAMFAVLIYPLAVLGFTGASVLLQTALDSLGNSGPHGLSEIIYLFASSNANNGSAFRRRVGADRAMVQERPLLPPPPVRDHRRRPQRFDEDDRCALQRGQLGRLESGADIAEAR
jgi:potassium-transporting ATPase potassium-binding subunit